jgi:hypothetical protein
MTQDITTAASAPKPPGPGESVRSMVRRARTGSLATLETQGGHPYASLVLVATLADGRPLMLLSRLARHTRNLLADARASLLIDDTRGTADPLAGGRATLIGRIAAPGDIDVARRRFLARHASAAGYADFADFAYYALDVEAAHYVGGFGRIVELAAADVLIPIEPAGAVLAAEADICGHMNTDHADALALYATRLLGQPAGPWQMTGVDPEGADLACGDRTARLVFRQRIATPEDARRELVHLATAARGASS